MKFEARFRRSTEDEMLSEIRRVIAANGDVVPRPFEFEKLSEIKLKTVTARFGGYGEAVSRAGYVYDPKKFIYTRRAVESDLQRVLAINNGFRFSHDAYKTIGGICDAKTVKSLLNVRSWDEVMGAIGAQDHPHIVRITPHALRRRELADLTEDALLDDIGRVWGLEGRRPTCSEFKKKCIFSTHILRQRFGSWAKAIEAYCKREAVAVQGRPGTRTTNEILLGEIRSVLLKHPNAPLTYDSYKKNGGTYSIKTFRDCYGSWTEAVRNVNAASGRIKYTTDQLFDELQSLWERLGRQPTFREMGEKGAISGGSYQRAFGNWKNAICAFCDDRDKEVVSSGPEEVEGAEAHSLAGTDAMLPSQGLSVGVVHKASAISSKPLVVTNVKTILKATPRPPSKVLRFKVLMRDEFRCRYCGRSTEKDGVTLEVDHKVPYAGEGETTIENLLTACRDCNQGKSDRRISSDLFQR